MDSKKPSHLSLMTTEQLIAQRKKTIGASAGLGIVMLASIAFLIYQAITNNRPALIAVALGSSMCFLPLLINLGMLNKELKSRSANGNNNGY